MTKKENLTLDNGARILLLPDREARSVSASLWVTAGSVWEQPEEQGVSHFIEHMVFKGTARRSARDISEEMDRLGGGINAYTARECTRYYAQTLKENAGAVLDLLCDIVLHPRLDEADMELERRVILEEMAMYEDNGEEVAHEALCASLWPDSPLGRAICGTVETVSALTVGDLRRYRDRHYAPGRLLAVVAGGFDREEVLERLHRELGVLPAKETPPPAPPPVYRPGLILRKRDFEQTAVELAVPGLPRGDDQRFAMMLFNFIVGGGASSRLFQRVREERGLAYSVYSASESFGGAGLFTVSALTSPERQLEVLREIRAVLDGFSYGVGREEVDRARAQVKASYILGLETVEARAAYEGRSALFHAGETSPDEVLARLDALNPSDIDALAARLLAPEKMGLAVAGPVEGAEVYTGMYGGGARSTENR